MIAPATSSEQHAAERVRRRAWRTRPGVGANVWVRTFSNIQVGMARLERLGLVEAWPEADGSTLWRATDEPPRFDRPHWRCELTAENVANGWRYDRYALHVELDPGHPCYVSLLYVPNYAADDVDALAFYLADTVENAQAEIARAIALRSAGDPCECGGCE